MNEFTKELYSRGKKERLIGETVSLEECRLVLNGILSSFTNEVIFMRNESLINNLEDIDGKKPCTESFIDEHRLTTLKERAVKLILKALR